MADDLLHFVCLAEPDQKKKRFIKVRPVISILGCLYPSLWQTSISLCLFWLNISFHHFQPLLHLALGWKCLFLKPRFSTFLMSMLLNTLPHVVVSPNQNCYFIIATELLSSILIPKTIGNICFPRVTTYGLRTIVLRHHRLCTMWLSTWAKMMQVPSLLPKSSFFIYIIPLSNQNLPKWKKQHCASDVTYAHFFRRMEIRLLAFLNLAFDKNRNITK